MIACRVSEALVALWMVVQLSVPLPAQTHETTKLPAQGEPVKTSVASNMQPEVLTSDAIVQMVAAGLDEETIIAKINASPAVLALSTGDLIRLKEAKIPQGVLRAMLAKEAQPEAPVVAVPAVPDQVIVRQGSTISRLTTKPQKVMFIKSEASDVKSAVANILLSDVGLQLLTMGLSPQMGMWNPYMGDSIRKAANIGKGMLLNRGSDTKGFEIETLPGLTADVTLKEGKAEFFVPVNRYVPSADFDSGTMEPVVLRLEPQKKDQDRVLSGRKVRLKQAKKGRFDLKPTTERQESDVEQTTVPVTVERMPENVLKITTRDDLKRGEYSLLFRRKGAAGAYTTNVPLKPDARPAAAAPTDAAAAIPGMTPEMMAMMGPEQVAAMQQQQNANQGRGGMLGMKRGPSNPPPAVAATDGSVAGFLAWDFRVMP